MTAFITSVRVAVIAVLLLLVYAETGLFTTILIGWLAVINELQNQWIRTVHDALKPPSEESKWRTKS